MSVRDVVKAELNIGQKPSEKYSWPAATADVVASKRTNRSSKPEVIYRLSDASLLVADRSVIDIASPAVTHQPRASPLTTSLPNLQRPISPTTPQSVDLQDVFPPPPASPPPPLYNLDDETLSLNSSSEEEFDMEDKSVMPSSFRGKAGDDADSWLRHFTNYCQYKEYIEAKSLALFKVLMAGMAADWLEGLSSDVSADYQRLIQAYNARYKTPDILKFKSAKEIFSRKQEEGENVDDFVAQMRKIGKVIGSDEKLLSYAILNGLKSPIAAYVTQQKPQNLDGLLEAARVAELTCPAKQPQDAAIAEQLADVKAEIRRLASCWEKPTVASMSSRSPSPSTRRVSFDMNGQRPQRPQSPGLRCNWPTTNYTGSPGWHRGGSGPYNAGGRSMQYQARPRRGTTYGNPRFGTFPRFPSQEGGFSSQDSSCPKCGRRKHYNINQCPAVNQMCNYCQRRGHFSAVCRAAARDRDQSTNNN